VIARDPSGEVEVSLQGYGKSARQLRFRVTYGGEELGTIEVDAKQREALPSKKVQILDKSGGGKAVRLEMLHDPSLTPTWRPGRKYTAILKRHGLQGLGFSASSSEPPFQRNELEIWPMVPKPGSRTRAPEPRKLGPGELQAKRKLEAALRRLESRYRIERETHEELIQNKKDQPFVSYFADLLGDADMPPRSIWEDAERHLEWSRRALERRDFQRAAEFLAAADRLETDAYAAVKHYRGETISGGERAVRGLEVAKTVGEVAAQLVPGFVGGALRGAYQFAEPMSEAVTESDPVKGPADIIGQTRPGPRGGPGAGGAGKLGGPKIRSPRAGDRKLLWGRWEDYPKIAVRRKVRTTVDGKVKVTIQTTEYAKIGRRYYTEHAVQRMRPGGAAPSVATPGQTKVETPKGPSGRGDVTYQGRGVSPNWVEEVIRRGSRQTFRSPEGVARTRHSLGSVTVITEQRGKIVVTIIGG
jgi:hypothetical protein